MTENKLEESSANLYIANMVRLNGGNFNSAGFLKSKRDEILVYLEPYEVSTQISYLCSILAVLNFEKKSVLYGKVIDFYEKKLEELSGVKREKLSRNEKTDTQKENWIEWEEVQKVREEYKAEVLKFSKQSSLNRFQFETMIEYVILSLFTMIPPRRNLDYQECWILIRGVEDEKKNYLDMENQEFHFRKYKTSKIYGLQTVKVPDELMEVINLWMRFHPDRKAGKGMKEIPLLCNWEGRRNVASNYITLKLNKIFKRKVGASMLRHIYLSQSMGKEYLALQEEMRQKAKEMGHSEKTQLEYIKK